MSRKLILFFVSYFIGLTCLQAQNFESNGIYYAVIDSSVQPSVQVVNSPLFYTDSVTIPDSVLYEAVMYRVTHIGDNAFASCSQLVQIDLPASLRSIGNGAFAYCTQLTGVTLPDGVTTVGNFVFGGCSGLQQVTLSNNLQHIGQQMFVSCSSLSAIVVPLAVRSIQANAFYGCSALQSVVLAEGLQQIDASAFGYCLNLGRVSLPATLVTLGANAFEGDESLVHVDFGDGLQSIGRQCFSTCVLLDSIVIPQHVVFVAPDAFELCSGLQNFEVDVNNLVYRSEGNVLYSNDGSRLIFAANGIQGGVVALSSVQQIEAYAFYQCMRMDSLVLGAAVDSIGDYAFDGCIGLEALTCYATEPPVAFEHSFSAVDSNLTIYIPYGTTAIYDSASVWKQFFNWREMPLAAISVPEVVDVLVNVVSDVLRVNLDVDMKGCLLRVIDLYGREMYHCSYSNGMVPTEMSVSVCGWPSGWYVLCVENRQFRFLVK